MSRYYTPKLWLLCHVQTQLKWKTKPLSGVNSFQIPIASNCICVLYFSETSFFCTEREIRRQDGCIRIEIKVLYNSTAFVKKAENRTRLDLEFSKWDGVTGRWKTPEYLRPFVSVHRHKSCFYCHKSMVSCGTPALCQWVNTKRIQLKIGQILHLNNFTVCFDFGNEWQAIICH